MIEIKKFIFGPFSENTYLLFDTDSREALIIDPGNVESFEDVMLQKYIDQNNFNLKYIIATHSHIDHILGVKFLKDNYDAAFLAPEGDMELLQNLDQQGSMFGIKTNTPPDPDEYISEEKEIFLGSCRGSFIFTPGHTPGEHCVYFESEKMLFSGDVIFRDSIGRTDLWGGDFQTILDSISQKLLKLPDDVIVYPGHSGETTIGYEKKHNSFLKKL